ncbi:hypothetical protein AC1031_011606 [Aphanomyces cochlioides]|nr:hypothetical protein AC1031_011606 [Aphanomyces cochlioides]
MRILTPLALAASAAVAFHQDSSIPRALEESMASRRFVDVDRTLSDKKYEKKYSERCSAIGAACGRVAGKAIAAGKAMFSKPGARGYDSKHYSWKERVKIAGIAGGATGEMNGKNQDAKFGARLGKAKDERIARRKAATKHI